MFSCHFFRELHFSVKLSINILNQEAGGGGERGVGNGKFSSVAQLCPTLRAAMDCSTPAFPVVHQLLGNRKGKEQILNTHGSTNERVELVYINDSIFPLKLLKVRVCVNNCTFIPRLVCTVHMQLTWAPIAVSLITAKGWKQPGCMSVR